MIVPESNEITGKMAPGIWRLECSG